MARQRPVGTITRGTTNPNRLRRVDRWLAGPQAWRLRQSQPAPVVVDLGYGASPVTAVELHDRLRQVRPDVEVVGIEIEPDRVALGRPLERRGLSFRLGGFEVPLDGREATVVRAFNVLQAVRRVRGGRRLGHRPGPADPRRAAGRRHLRRAGPAQRLDRGRPVRPAVAQPVLAAARAGPTLRHRRAPPQVADPPQRRRRTRARLAAARWTGPGCTRRPHASFGVRQRFLAAVEAVRAEGWPVADGPSRWRLGEVTVDWSAVAPLP